MLPLNFGGEFCRNVTVDGQNPAGMLLSPNETNLPDFVRCEICLAPWEDKIGDLTRAYRSIESIQLLLGVPI